MKVTPVFSSLLAAAALAACGKTGTTDDFRAAAPTSDKIAISEYDGDPVGGTAADDPSSSAQQAARPECHPHLFVRTHEIIGRLNWHIPQHLPHIDKLIETTPPSNRETRTLYNARAGIERK